MNRFHRLLILLLSSVAPLHAVMVNTIAPSMPSFYETAAANGPGWSYVGTVASPFAASGVYLGKYQGFYWVLTADHNGIANFTLGSTTYTAVAGSYKQVAPNVDLGVFRIVGGSQLDLLTNLTLGSTLSGNSNLNMIGYGGGIKRGGFNTPNGIGTISYPGYTETAFVTDYDTGNATDEGEAQAVGGDSGGGVFYENNSTLELSGLMVATGTLNGKPATYSVDITTYKDQISDAVPEPGSLVLIGSFLGAGTFLAIQKRHRRDK